MNPLSWLYQIQTSPHTPLIVIITLILWIGNTLFWILLTYEWMRYLYRKWKT